MEINPEKLPELSAPRKNWLLMLVLLLIGFILIFFIQQAEANKAKFAKIEEAMGSSAGLAFSHGLMLGDPFEGLDSLKVSLQAKGFNFLRELEPTSFEFRSADGLILLRVKAKEELGVTAIYEYVSRADFPKFEKTYHGRDLLGYDKAEIKRIFGRPRMISKHIREVFKKGEPITQAWAYETWLYEGSILALSVSFNFEGKVVETALQLPVSSSY